jgi:hypothetical protein
MREMILNHASVKSPDLEIATSFLREIVIGIAELVRAKHCSPVILSHHPLYEIMVTEGLSVSDVLHQLKEEGFKDEYIFFLRLNNKAPFIDELEYDIRNRLLGCQAIDLSIDDGAPLILCAQTDAVEIGFPSDALWDQDRVVIHWEEIQSDETFLVVKCHIPEGSLAVSRTALV